MKTLITAPGFRQFAEAAHPKIHGVHVTDPAPFLSTIVAATAALVAYIVVYLVSLTRNKPDRPST